MDRESGGMNTRLHSISFRNQAKQDAQDLRDVLGQVDIYRCRKCKRLGVRPGLLCGICGDDPSMKEEK